MAHIETKELEMYASHSLHLRRRTATWMAVGLAAIFAFAGCAETDAEPVDDETLRANVEQRIAGEHDHAAVHVQTSNGVVLLTGTVETPDKRTSIEDLVENIEGVEEVRNEIEVRSEQASSELGDAWIQTKIEAKLTADLETNPLVIGVDVDDGVVTLSGDVSDETTRQEAERIAADTEGVKEVRNQIVVNRS